MMNPVRQQMGAHLLRRSKRTATSVDWQKVRQELKVRRTQLFDRLVKNPGDVCLAIEIKMLDDRILECAERLQREQDDH
jgi:hypothetical protein